MKMTDRNITLAVEEMLQADEQISAHLVDVETRAGIVILSGEVDTLRAKEHASEVAEMIKGVRSVVNQIEVRPAVRSDEEIEKDILKALAYDPTTQDYPIEVSVRGGVVTLRGNLDSWQKKLLAGQVVKEIKGIREVENNISVQYRTDRLDHEIEAEIKSRLAQDIWLDEALIEVDVEDGEVQLSGAVGSAAEKSRAYTNAWVNSVSLVEAEDLDVEWEERPRMYRKSKYTLKTDEEIREAIKQAFLYDPRVISFNPGIEVADGVVTLTGVVDNLMAKKAAGEDAQNTIGVRRVKNLLKVRPTEPPSDMELAQNIREALLWNPGVNRHQIIISCHNKKVYLHGTVHSFHEKGLAEDVAGRVKGVVEVENNLNVDRTWRWKSDEEIKENIEERLNRASRIVTDDKIVVMVEDGIATLTGTVRFWQQRDILIEHALRGGAKNVVSHISIHYASESGEG